MEFLFSDIASILGKSVSAAEDKLVITGFSTDTRAISPGMMFFAIPGENFDGGDYVDEAFKKGASGVITERNIKREGVINVEDTVRSLGRLAGVHRDRKNIPVVAVTGSTGKTTARNFIISVLETKLRTHFTRGNFNNHIGLPMMLLEMEEHHEVSVLEMGMSGLGEIDYLAGIAKPDIGVITNIGMSHIGLLGSRENIFKAKTEIIGHIRKGGILFVNGDDEYLSKINDTGCLRVVRFGKGTDNDIKISNETADQEGCFSFNIGNEEYRLGVMGYHNIYNAAAAVAVGRELGLSYQEIREGLLGFRQEKLRLEKKEKNGITTINDSYNANPDSMKAAIKILGMSKGRRIAVLGDMLELGKFSKNAHIEVGKNIPGNADILICCGKEAQNFATGAILEGHDEEAVHFFDTSDEAGDFIRCFKKQGDTILLKGSRGMKMENIIKYIETGEN